MQGKARHPVPPVVMRRVSKRYGKTTALEGVDLVIEPGQVTSILGPNGAGKTTAVKLQLGLLRPDSGEVRLFGLPPHQTEARVRTGAMMQISTLPATLAVGELVRLFRTYYQHAFPFAPDAVLAVWERCGGSAQDLQRCSRWKLRVSAMLAGQLSRP